MINRDQVGLVLLIASVCFVLVIIAGIPAHGRELYRTPGHYVGGFVTPSPATGRGQRVLRSPFKRLQLPAPYLSGTITPRRIDATGNPRRCLTPLYGVRDPVTPRCLP